MIVLWILLGVLFFLFLLLLCPLRAEISFQTEFSLSLRYLFLRFPLLPSKKEEKKEEKEEPEKTSKASPSGVQRLRSILKQQGASGFLRALFDFLALVKASTFRLAAGLKVLKFDLYYTVGGKEDAALAAQRYGELSAGIYSACGVLFQLKKCRKKGVCVDLNFNVPEDLVNFSARLSVRPIALLKEGIGLLAGGMPLIKMFLNKKDQPVKERKKGE